MGITIISHSPRALSPHLTCLCPWRTLYILTCRRPPPCHLPCLSGRGSDPPQPRALPLWQLFRATSCPVPAHCQTQAPPYPQTPQLRVQAQSPLCHLHSEEPAKTPLPPPPPPQGDLGSRNSPPPPLGPFPSWRVHHYVRKAPLPLQSPYMPAEACTFIPDYSRTSV